MQDDYIFFKDPYLGSITFRPQSFSTALLQELEAASFAQKTIPEKHHRISYLLCKEILSYDGELFLLPQLVHYIERARKLLPSYHLGSFEFWLNHYGDISEEEKFKIRGALVGKYLPRMEYASFFPYGEENGSFFGPHYSIAHFSPDLDTTVASFFCFLNAFACRIGRTRNHWVVPGGPPKDSVEIDLVFHKTLGSSVFSTLGHTEKSLSISSLDLLTQKNMLSKKLSDSSYSVDHERSKNAVVLVDEEGCYRGDWRDEDVEAVGFLTNAVLTMVTQQCNFFTEGLIALLHKKSLQKADMEAFIGEVLRNKLCKGLYSHPYAQKQHAQLDLFLRDILHLPRGYDSSFEEFLTHIEPSLEYALLKKAIVDLPGNALFSPKGTLFEDRQTIFTHLSHLLAMSTKAYAELQRFLHSLGMALAIKQKVLGHSPTVVSHLAEYEEIQDAMKQYWHLTVVYKEGDKMYPLGIIRSEDSSRKILASASWNDFSNPLETNALEEVEVISVIDHHKTNLSSKKPLLAILKDVQASNTICATLAFAVNDLYSTNGMTLEEIEKEIQIVSQNLDNPVQIRLLERLLKRKKVALEKAPFYVSRDREILEYYQFLFAILDDTDLLTKITPTDVDCMRDLLNRLKSLMLRKEVEIVHFDEITRSDPLYAKKAAQHLLQTPDLYSLSAATYRAKENLLNEIILKTEEGADASFFQDTKILNGYAEVGQFKFFASNEPTVRKRIAHLRNLWLKRCLQRSKENADCSLFIFMLSTLSSAEELFADVPDHHTYKDELWFWIPQENKKAAHQLSSFLEEFSLSPHMKGQEWEIEFLGKAKEYEKTFADALQRPFICHHSACEIAAAIVKVPQKRIKSRKTDIAIYLHTLPENA